MYQYLYHFKCKCIKQGQTGTHSSGEQKDELRKNPDKVICINCGEEQKVLKIEKLIINGKNITRNIINEPA